MEWLADPKIWIALLTLTVLEIVLGVDNIIFISILAGKLRADQQRPGTPAGAGARDVHAHRPPGFDCVDRPADGATF